MIQDSERDSEDNTFTGLAILFTILNRLISINFSFQVPLSPNHFSACTDRLQFLNNFLELRGPKKGLTLMPIFRLSAWSQTEVCKNFICCHAHTQWLFLVCTQQSKISTAGSSGMWKSLLLLLHPFFPKPKLQAFGRDAPNCFWGTLTSISWLKCVQFIVSESWKLSGTPPLEQVWYSVSAQKL